MPQVCDNLFKQISAKSAADKDNQFEVTFSMVEIYNEQVKDLLSVKSLHATKGLSIHERPGKGFHSKYTLNWPLIRNLNVKDYIEK